MAVLVGRLRFVQQSHVKAAKKELNDGFDVEIALYAVRNAERVFRTASVSGGALAKRKLTIATSRAEPKK